MHPREISFVLWGHCQNLLDDPRIYLEEVTRAIDRTNLSSAPSPEDKVFSILIKTGGDNMAAALLHLFQTCWSSGTLCESFKLDPKILIINLVKTITTGLVVRASDSGSGDPGSILGRVGVLIP